MVSIALRHCKIVADAVPSFRSSLPGQSNLTERLSAVSTGSSMMRAAGGNDATQDVRTFLKEISMENRS
ncbi:MAG TPA: hypothetical protein VFG38_06220 [Pseudomonadales bacterium]|nr:hypothetical protein [Pseudomonadales bacterium]